MNGPPAGIDWPALMRAGIRGLGLRPREFWVLTPAELELMLGKPAGVAPLKRSRLDALLADYPDGNGETSDE
ncbi:rcc01693 family protein [Roseovarius aestuariivivens]|uniref:rcc01693 family protein n=1 Tax=Roseovarius aestuariivivens TaxID=1888910 RepID=UPI0024782AE6|nr:rcc01693 family protein [Roseovarius aestuariivivens]